MKRRRRVCTLGDEKAAEGKKRQRQLYELDCRKKPTGEKFPEGASGSVTTPAKAALVFQAFSARKEQESLMAIYLDARYKTIGFMEVAKGALNAVHASPREVFRPAIHLGAAAVIIAHNHPSGCHNPSSEDMDLTRRFSEAGKILGIPLMDHIVVSDCGSSSAKGEGLMGLGKRRRRR